MKLKIKTMGSLRERKGLLSYSVEKDLTSDFLLYKFGVGFAKL